MIPKMLRAALLASALSLAGPAAAETLAQAIASAYEGNPDIAAQRQLVRQVDEQAPQALATYARPNVAGTASATQNGADFDDNGRVAQAGVQVGLPLYRGGRTRLATSAAENRILAARARLRAAENTVIVNVVTAYADVIRYGRVVELNENNVKVLERELQASKDRFEVGDLTRTDVAQSQARLAGAQASLVAARNQLTAARAAYARVVGHEADNLAPLPALPPLPGTVGQAVDLASANNPSLLASQWDEAAARYDVKVYEAQRLPSLDATANASYQRYDNYGGSTGAGFAQQGGYFTQGLGLSATVPIYQSGLIGSYTRQAQARRSQLQSLIVSTQRQVSESATNAFNALNNARAIIGSSTVARDANALALEGVRQENQVGTRTVLEVLNAEQELLQSEVDLATAQRDEQVAGYQLLSAVGAAEAGALGVPVQEYDAESNARRVRNEIWDSHDPDAPALPTPDPARASRSMLIGPPAPTAPKR
jgi:outer membrane protein